MNKAAFKREIWKYYQTHGRDFLWRETHDPYRIVVSEIMLQQTQTHRVEPKYEAWVKEFPNFAALAAAPMPEVLKAWHGLGYNRRAMYLKKIAQTVVNDYGGKLPNDPAQLIELSGIGKNTVGSIMAFAFNTPAPFIETNIRRVYIHFFFPKKKSVHDDQILKLVTETLDKKNPREWYYALMDYGAMLKGKVTNPNRRSKHYTKQSKFEGSERQVRGLILKMLLDGPQKTLTFVSESQRDPVIVTKILADLVREGFIIQSRSFWRLKF